MTSCVNYFFLFYDFFLFSHFLLFLYFVVLLYFITAIASLRALAAECRDTEACPFQILSRFTQPHRLCIWSQSEIYQNLDSYSAATIGPRAQVNYANKNFIS